VVSTVIDGGAVDQFMKELEGKEMIKCGCNFDLPNPDSSEEKAPTT